MGYSFMAILETLKGIVFTIFLCFAHGFGFLRLWVFLGESLGFLPLEEIESFIGFEYRRCRNRRS